MAKATQDDELVFLPLGGSNEIGMNFNLYGFGPPHDRKWIVVDLGITFGDQTTPDRKLTTAAQSTPGSSSSPALGRRTYQKGLQTLAWKADDENDDDLVYDVLFRREGELAWKTLRKAATDPILVWDTTTVPNGTYFVRIVASDAPSNPLGTALSG